MAAVFVVSLGFAVFGWSGSALASVDVEAVLSPWPEISQTSDELSERAYSVSPGMAGGVVGVPVIDEGDYAAGGGAHLPGRLPEFVSTPTSTNSWGALAFDDATLEFRLVGRGVVEGADVEGSVAAFGLADDATHVSVASGMAVEEWVVEPDGAADWSVSRSWELDLPAGWSAHLIEQGTLDGQLAITDADSWIRATVAAPYYLDEIGAQHPLSMEWDADTSRVVVTAFPMNDGAVGDLAIDPMFAAYATAGEFQYKICPGALATDSCGSGSSWVTGWGYSGSSGYGSDYNYGSTTSWGRYVGVKANTTIASNAYVRNKYYPDSGLLATVVNWKGQMQNSSGKYSCRVDGIFNGSTVSNSSWVTTTTDFQKILSAPSSGWTATGVRLQNTSGASHTTNGTENSQRCTSHTSSNDGEVIVTLADATGPTIATGSFSSNGGWYTDPMTKVAVRMSAFDNESGIRYYKPQINGQDVATVDMCGVPDGTTSRPCPTVPGEALFELRLQNAVQGTNYVSLNARDFSGRYSSSPWVCPTCSFKFDSQAPYAPATPQPNSASVVHGGATGVTLSWATSTDTTNGSGVSKYAVCASRTSTGCDNALAFNALTPTNSVTAELGSGKWYWRVKAVDAAGLRSPASTQATIIVDSIAPSVTVTQPAGEVLSLRSTSDVSLAATASDDDGDAATLDAGVASVKWEYRRSDQSSWTTIATDASSPYSATASNFAPGDGAYELRAVATDSTPSAPNWRTSHVTGMCIDTATLAQPTSVKHRLIGTPVSSAEVWWTAPGSMSGIVGFLVERQDTGGGAWQQVARVPRSVTSVSDPAVTSSSATYRVESIGQSCSESAKGNGTTSSADTSGYTEQSPQSSPRVGVQSHWQFDTVSLGGGADASVNVAGGNVVLSKPLQAGTGPGFDVAPVLVHNSQENAAHTSNLAIDGLLGDKWTLGLSGLAPGEGITSFTGVSLESIAGSAAGSDLASVTVRDDSGATSVFDSPTSGVFEAQAGTYLHVRDWQAAGENDPGIAGARVVGTRPDRVSYYWASPIGGAPEDDGRLLAVRDRLGRGLTLSYECVQVHPTSLDVDVLGDSPCSSYTPATGYVARYRLKQITTSGNRSYTLGYYDREPADGDRALDGRLASITDFAGVVTSVAYDRTTSGISVSPRLVSVTEAAGVSGVARETSFVHAFVDNPSTRWGDESQLITGVVDPRGNTTYLTYGTPSNDALPRVVRILDRENANSSGEARRYSYGVVDGDLDGTTTIKDELSNATTFRWDALGRITSTVNAVGERQRSEYTAGNRVSKSHTLLREDESVVLTGTATTALAETSVAAHVEVRVRSAANQSGTLYAEGSDYVLVRSNPATLARAGSSSIPSGGTVYVTYINATSEQTWDADTGYQLTSRSPKGTTSTPGELDPATVTTYTNTALGGHVADIQSVTTPRGTATTGDSDDFKTTYSYDSHYRLVSVTAPINAGSGDAADLSTRTITYMADAGGVPSGDVSHETSAEGITVGYSHYDASGQPLRTYKPTTGAFDPNTTPVETIALIDVMGRTTCTDDKRETGDAISIDPCDWTTSSGTNRSYSTTVFDQLGREVATTSAFNDTLRRATNASFDKNDNQVSVTDNVAYTPSTSDPYQQGSPSGGMTTVTSFDLMDRELSSALPSNDDDDTPRIATKTYDSAGQLVRDVAAQGVATLTSNDYTTRYSYDAVGRQIGEIDGAGSLTCTYFDRLGNAVATAQPNAFSAGTTTCPGTPPSTYVESSTYDRAGRVTQSTDVAGKTTQSSYDIEDNVTAETDEAGETTTITNAADGEELAIIEPARPVCTSTTSCSSTSSQAPVSEVAYDKDGNVIAETSERQNVEAPSDADAFTTEYSFNVDGEQQSTTLPRDDVAATADADRHMHSVIDDEGSIVATTLQTSADTAPTAAQTATCTNEANTVNSISCAEITQWDYTADGSIDDKSDNATETASQVTYDASGEVATRTEHGVTTSYTYYDDGSLRTETKTEATVPFAVNTPYGEGQCVSTAGGYKYIVAIADEPFTSGATTPTWGANEVISGAVTFRKSACESVVQHYYDRAGTEIKAVETTSTLAGSFTRVYEVLESDGTGRELWVRNWDGTETITSYNRNGDILDQSVDGRKITNTYGASGSATGKITSSSISRAGGTSLSADFTYDSAGRLATVTRNSSPNKIRTTYTYDAASMPTQAITQLVNSGGTLLSGEVIVDLQYTYDAAANIRVKKERIRQAGAPRWAASTAYTLGTIVEPTTANGHVYVVSAAGTSGTTQPTWPTGEGTTVASGSVTFKELTARTEYAYDGQNRLVTEDRPEDPGTTAPEVTLTYAFNEMGALAQVSTPDCAGSPALETYTYSSADPSIVSALDVDTVTGTTSCTGVTGESDVTVSHGGSGQEGSITSVSTDPAGAPPAVTKSFQHDVDNQLAQVSVAGVVQQTTRDAQGARLADTSDGEEVDYDYAGDDPDPAGVQEGDEDEPTGILEDPNGLTIAILSRSASLNRYVVSDHQNTPVSTLTTGAVVVSTTDYDAYGQEESLWDSGPADDTSIGYTGSRLDPASGTFDNQARSYDPQLRQWITTDTFRTPVKDMVLSIDPRNYLRTGYAGDPVNHVDPTGHALTSVRPTYRTCKKVFDSSALCAPLIVIGAAAQRQALRRWKRASDDGKAGNAFQHAYWMAKMARYLRAHGWSEDTTLGRLTLFGRAYESQTWKSYGCNNQGKKWICTQSKRLDLRNNRAGLNLALNRPSGCRRSGSGSIINCVIRQMVRGKLRVFGRRKTSNCLRREHGRRIIRSGTCDIYMRLK